MPFLHNERYESIAHCGELLSATRGVLFVLKTPFFAKKIQKHEILPCNKLLFSLSVQNEEISYKNSWFRIFFVRNSSFWGYLRQTNLKVSEIVVLKSTQKGLPAPDSDASYNCGFSKGKWPSASHHDGAAFTLPSMALIGWREHRVRVAPAAQPLSKKISQSPPHLCPGEQSFSAGL